MVSSCDFCTASSSFRDAHKDTHAAWKTDDGEQDSDQNLQNHMRPGGTRQEVTVCCLSQCKGQQASTSNSLWEVIPDDSSSLWGLKVCLSSKTGEIYLSSAGLERSLGLSITVLIF